MTGRFTACFAVAALAFAAPKKPVYLGARACGACHAGPAMGNQYEKWLQSKHARAYAVLSKPESIEIARRSGVRETPWTAPVCLGCHSTAYNTENWERDDDFHPEDGMQCEACHGPGSEYANAATMRNRDEAKKAGLRMPTSDDCMGCHVEKGSHTAVIPNSTVDVQWALKQIAHPLATPARPGSLPSPGDEKFVGSHACGACHNTREKGFQYDAWRRGPHARAWAVLASDRAKEIALGMNVGSDPRSSSRCLGCHATGADPDEGVGCEACHGPGKQHSAAAANARLSIPEKTGCNHCHSETHGRNFDLNAGWKAITHPSKLAPVATPARYKTPINLALRPNSTELWVACEGSDSVIVVDSATRRKITEIPTGGAPHDVAFTPDGKRAFVSNRDDDTVSVIDAAQRKIAGALKTGDSPHGLLTDRAGKYLYVAQSSSDDIFVYDAATLAWVKKLAAGRGPWSLALSPDGASLAVTNIYSHLTGFRQPLRSEVTVIDTASATVSERHMVPGANLMMGVAWHPSGRYALATLNRTKNLVPMTRLLQGWLITNGLAVVWNDGRVDQVLLDQPGLGFSDVNDIAFTPDGRFALVTSSGTNRIAVVDCLKLTNMLQAATPEERKSIIPNHLGKSAGFVVKYIETSHAPRGITVSPDGSAAYAAVSIDDSVAVIDLRKMEFSARIDLGGPKEETKQRYGERLFHSANITFRRQFSCSSCHPDGHVDGLTYDIESDGIGVSPVDNRTLRGIFDTAPFKWEGTNATLSRQCGPRLSIFFTRIQPFTPAELDAVEYYVTTIPRPANRHHTPGEKYTPAQMRGRAVFERTTTADGREIPVENRCVTCHMPPYYTSRKIFDVGSRQALDRQARFDIPHLNNIYDSPPYMHNGMAATLEEIWTVYNPRDTHGVTNDLTKDQLNDLIEYLKTL